MVFLQPSLSRQALSFVCMQAHSKTEHPKQITRIISVQSLVAGLFTQRPTTHQAQPQKTQTNTKPTKEAPTASDFKRSFLNQDKTPAPAKPAAHKKEEKASDSNWKKGFLL
ncbi:MAG: hypothetical protein P1U32_03385 [Legionellaceae bacterium]|nr:hypothetical protein [Legionellaceae bacterium]